MPSGKPTKGFLFALIVLIALVAGIPLVLSQSQVQQILSGNAWYTSQSASAACDAASGKVSIKVSFTNKESSRGMNVAAVDLQSGKSVDLGKIDAGKTKTGTIDTQRDSLNSGFVTFKLTWSDGSSGTDSRNAGYSQVNTCVSPTPSSVTPSSKPSGSVTPPTGTVTPTSPPDGDATPTPTYPPNSTITPSNPPNTTTSPKPSPTTCPTPGTVKNIKIQCPYCTPNPVPNK